MITLIDAMMQGGVYRQGRRGDLTQPVIAFTIRSGNGTDNPCHNGADITGTWYQGSRILGLMPTVHARGEGFLIIHSKLGTWYRVRSTWYVIEYVKEQPWNNC